MKPLSASDFLPLNIFEGIYPVKVNLVYAKPDHADNHFKNLYHPDARLLWVHKDILPILLLVSVQLYYQSAWSLRVNDVLRPIEAQLAMANYGYPENLVSPPGVGAHPRGMSIDIEPVDQRGRSIEMGTPYDFFASDLANNPAARDAEAFSGKTPKEAQAIVLRRLTLTDTVSMAAKMFGHEILPLPDEWWDYRFKKGDESRVATSTYWDDFGPATEGDYEKKTGTPMAGAWLMPDYMKLVGKPAPVPAEVKQAWVEAFKKINDDVRNKAEILGIAWLVPRNSTPNYSDLTP